MRVFTVFKMNQTLWRPESSCVDRQIPPIEDTESESDKFWISSSVGDGKERCSCVEFSKSLLEDIDSRKLLDDFKGLVSSEWTYSISLSRW